MKPNIKKHLGLLGLRVEDKVTRFKGVVSTMSFDLYGCIQAVVTPVAKEDGTVDNGKWFDVARLNVLDDQPVMERPDYDFGPVAQGEHGSAEKPAFDHA